VVTFFLKKDNSEAISELFLKKKNSKKNFKNFFNSFLKKRARGELGQHVHGPVKEGGGERNAHADHAEDVADLGAFLRREAAQRQDEQDGHCDVRHRGDVLDHGGRVCEREGGREELVCVSSSSPFLFPFLTESGRRTKGGREAGVENFLCVEDTTRINISLRHNYVITRAETSARKKKSGF
jgi:hypothetical protein